MIIKEDTGTTARRYSRRDHQLGVIPLPEVVFQFISVQENGGVTEINFRFPSIFQQGVTLPCGQVQSLAIGALVTEYGLDFIFLFIIDDIRGWRREGGVIWFHGAIGR